MTFLATILNFARPYADSFLNDSVEFGTLGEGSDDWAAGAGPRTFVPFDPPNIQAARIFKTKHDRVWDAGKLDTEDTWQVVMAFDVDLPDMSAGTIVMRDVHGTLLMPIGNNLGDSVRAETTIEARAAHL